MHPWKKDEQGTKIRIRKRQTSPFEAAITAATIGRAISLHSGNKALFERF
jgi:hypothetical protein